MAGCPTCQFEMNIPSENHGSLMTCPSCQAVFFVNWDGLPEAPFVGEEEAASADMIAQQAEDVSTSENFQQGFQEAGFTEVESTEASQFQMAGVEAFPIDSSAGYPSAETHQFVESAVPETEFTSVSSSSELQPFEELQSVDAPLTPQQFVEEVIEFGNSTEPIEGLTYSLRILGIDSSAAREKLEDILREPRLVFDLQNLMSEIDNGQLEIDNLNAAKAFFLVQKLKQEAFDVSWFQKV